jgi:secondary thiamine-phosphate synthase enzyme
MRGLGLCQEQELNMQLYREELVLATHTREVLIDLTRQVRESVQRSGLVDGQVTLYAQGATCALMIQENWDESVQNDVITLLRRMIPPGIWEHDREDGNGDAHLKAGLVGPSETIPLMDGQLALSRWQNIFFCEFDGPKRQRTVQCTIIGSGV